MTCQEFGSIARDYSRREWISPRLQETAREHVNGCEDCRRRLDAERALDTGLHRLRASDEASQGASPAVEQAVMAAFAARQARAVPMRGWLWVIPAAATAAAVAFFLIRPAPAPVVDRQAQTETVLRRESAPQTPGSPAPLAAVSAEASDSEQPLRPIRRPRDTTAAPRTSRSAQPVERVSGFVPVRYGKPVEPGESLQMIRIQLPQQELMRLGIPVSPDTSKAFIKADVLIGEDGLAKAIRFVW